jgi:Domain of unknown function (DUF4157)
MLHTFKPKSPTLRNSPGNSHQPQGSPLRVIEAAAHQQAKFFGTQTISNQTALRMLSYQHPVIQAKLSVNRPGDRYEQEADRVAEQVMRMPDSSTAAGARLSLVSANSLQRKCSCNASGAECAECKKEEGVVQRRAADNSGARTVAPPVVHGVLQSAGQALPAETRHFMEPRFGTDFSKVRVHAGARAAESAAAVNALAYTVGPNIVFGAGQYKPSSTAGQKLLAHELAHVVQQQNAPPLLQRKVTHQVLDWDAKQINKPVPVNGPGGNTILLPPKPDHLQVSALVEVDGDATDNCAGWQFGTTQTAWMGWEIMSYQGRTASDGSVKISRRHTFPVRDPAPSGSIWYDALNVRSPASCGDSAGVFHVDGPWENVDKTVINGKAGGATNYLVGYTSGLHLVTYLTARDPAGNFLPQPLRFVYWNSLHDFGFTPNFSTPGAMWAVSGPGVRINVGAKGRGDTSDAPYFTTAGPTFNGQINDPANEVREEHK